MQDQIKQKLKAIIAQHGVKIVSTPKRVNGLLRDYFPQNMREVRLLSMALDEGMVQTIVQDHTSQSQLMLTARLSQRLHDNFGTDLHLAKWVMDTLYEVITTDEKELSDINEVNRLQELAEQGNALAQVKLGWHYITGRGVTKDAQQAFIWFKKSAEQGCQQAKDSLEAIKASYHTDEEITELLRSSARMGEIWAQDELKNRGLSW